MEKFDSEGREIPDTTPLEIPANARRPESMQDTIARLVAAHMSTAAEKQGMPSFEEEDDFSDPTEEVTEVGAEYYITEAKVQSLLSENDLDGSDGVLSSSDSGRGSTGDDPTSDAQHAGNEASEVEAPKEEEK